MQPAHNQKNTIATNRNDLIDEIVPKYNNFRSSFKVRYRLSAFKEFRKVNEEVAKKKIIKHDNVSSNFKEFCKNNTLHGLPYVGDDALIIGERTFWAIATVLSFILAMFFIFSIYRIHSNVPVIQNIDPLPNYIDDYPFPAVTICVKFTIPEIAAKEILSKRDPVEMNILNYTCHGKLCYQNFTAYESEDVVSDIKDPRLDSLKFVAPCDRILKICQFGGDPNSCGKIFKQILTKIGSCCTFNRISDEILFRHNQPQYTKFTYSSNVFDWTLRAGYPDGVSKSMWPWRPKGAGLKSGLVVVLDTSNISSYCKNNLGLNLLTFYLHKPTDEPELVQPSAISLGYETAIEIIPKVLVADQSLRKMVDPEQRGCFFDDERKLGLYRRYSRINCINECLANFTYSVCHCISLYYPQYKEWKICTLKKWCCFQLATDPLFLQKLEANKEYSCSCLNECETIEYDKIQSFGTLIQMPQKEYILKNYTNEYIRKNIAVLNFFFKSTTFVKTKKQAMYNFSQYLSNIGGILALFMGFSFFTAAEIIYYGLFKGVIYVLQVVRTKISKSKKNKIKPNQFNRERLKL